MRLASEFVNHDISRSNYVARVDESKCVACGECVESCPTNALRLGQKLCSNHFIDETVIKETPYDREWTQEDYNKDYRTNRKNTLDSGTAPCITKCPAHIPVQGYIKLASMGRYEEALELIKKHNPLPAVCGRVCPSLCEENCTRGNVDEAVAVDDIKKFIAEQDLNKDKRFMPRKRHDYSDKKIAIIGSGPTGTTCAYDLAIDGYDVTVFEKEERLGGMLTLGIPSYRLQKDVVEAEIDVIKDMGVKFVTGCEIGKDKTIQELRDEGFNGFYVAIGAQSGRGLGLEGEDAAEVIHGVDFLRTINLGKDSGVKGNVVVIGGGNVAIDVARSSARLDGVETVNMFCLEDADHMPAHDEEVIEAKEEDVVVNNSWGPVRVVTENGKVTGVEFKRCLSVFDADGRFNPSYDENDTKVVPCDYLLLSVGQTFAYGNLFEGEDIEFTPRKTIKVDPTTLQTSVDDIFAGGDVASGPKLAIDAIAAGKEAAVSLHRFVQRGQSLVMGRDMQEYVMLDKEDLTYSEGYDGTPRQKTKHIDGKVAKSTFKDLRETLTEEQIKKETNRCLGCGATKVDEYLCVGCGQCTVKCKFDAITLEKVRAAEGFEMDELPKAVMKNIVKRKIKLTVNKANPFKK
jgi:NADPH-dependent glutamate synthase beta subunit-like oxidoreductase